MKEKLTGGMTMNEFLFHKNRLEVYHKAIKNKDLKKAIKILKEIGFDEKDALLQASENINDKGIIYNIISGLFHSLTNYKFQK
ncbi:MAG: hypothetical protein KA275_05500 [Chitinophagaceae bacterium]|nr:hypothetical protein [Chitinophagaceae bacterium]